MPESTSTPTIKSAAPRENSPRVQATGANSLVAEFSRRIQAIRQSSNSRRTLIVKIARFLSRTSSCHAAWLVDRDGAGSLFDKSSLLDTYDESIWKPFEESIDRVIQSAAQSESYVPQDLQGVAGKVVVAVPVSVQEPGSEIFCGIFPSTLPAGMPLDWMLTLIASEIDLWECHEQVRSTSLHARSLSDFVNFSAALNKSEDRVKANLLIVNELRKLTDAHHTALILKRGVRRRYQVEAVSDVDSFDHQSETTSIIRAAAIAAANIGKPIVWCNGDDSVENPDATCEEIAVARQYCEEFSCDGCMAIPLLFSNGQTVGAILLGLNSEKMKTDGFQHYVNRLVTLIGAHLEVVLNSHRSMLRIFVDQVGSVSKRKAVRIGVAVALCLAMAMMIPMPYKVACDCQLQLVNRRFIAAPYDGILEKTIAENGDPVSKDQILARMDGRSLRMEIAGLQADLKSEQKKRDSALARGDVAESQIAKAEMSRLDSEIRILQDQLNNLEIRSPVDGVVVSGDLDKAEGAPLEMGQTLFEVGPLDEMLFEILVPESEIRHVQKGQTVSMELDSFPFEVFEGEITRIHPHTEVIEDESVFVAEICIQNELGMLRPGMKGRAKIVTDKHPIGWNLFHKAWEKSRGWLVW